MEIGDFLLLFRTIKTGHNILQVIVDIFKKRKMMNQKTETGNTEERTEKLLHEAAKEARELIREVRDDYRASKKSEGNKTNN